MTTSSNEEGKSIQQQWFAGLSVTGLCTKQCAFWVCALELLLGQGTQGNYLPGKGFRKDYQPTSRPQVLRGPSTQVVQSLKQRDCAQWFGRLRSNGFGAEFRTTYNYTTINLWWTWASYKGEPMSCSLGIYPGGRTKGARNVSWCGIWLLISEQPGRRSRFGPGVGEGGVH